MHFKATNEKTNNLRQNQQHHKMATLNDTENNNDSIGGGGLGQRHNSCSSGSHHSQASKSQHNHNNNNNINNNNNEDAISTKSHTPSTTTNTTINTSNTLDPSELKAKRQTLEQRKHELEKLLSEKSWLLQQIQKTETQIINGNYEYLNLNEIFAALAQQYQLEQALLQGPAGGSGVRERSSGSCGSDSAILRRKNFAASKEHSSSTSINTPMTTNNIGSSSNNNNSSSQLNNNNRNSEVSNRSSEYDNCPQLGGGDSHSQAGSIGSHAVPQQQQQQQQQQMPIKSALKKRNTPTPTPGNINFLHMHRQQHLQHYQQQQQQQSSPSRQYLPQPQFDAISLYSVNSANVATLRQQHVAPQQQPIIVQCDKYYLSPTHQSYNDGGFIRSSQNIKQYVSPLGSPTHYAIQYELAPQQQQQPQRHNSAAGYTPHPQHIVLHQHYQQAPQLRQLDSISLAPSYVSMDSPDSVHQSARWRSQTHLPSQQQKLQQQQPQHHHYTLQYQQSTHPESSTTSKTATRSSSDMLAAASSSNSTFYVTPTPAYPSPPPPPLPAAGTKPKHFDEISLSSLSSDTQQKQKLKPKQWLESSLDGPVIRTASNETHSVSSYQPQTSNAQKSSSRERAKLSSQSMSAAARHYSMTGGGGGNKHYPTASTAANSGSGVNASASATNASTKLLQNDDGRYAKLSQSTSYLNQMETASISAPYLLDTSIELLPSFKYLPPKISSSNSARATPPPRPEKPPAPLPAAASSPTASLTPTPTPLTLSLSATPTAGLGAGATGSLHSPDIRIESPKNMTVVQQATFQPYKEITKPFEMSDFYKYSTKFRQKEPSSGTLAGAASQQTD